MGFREETFYKKSLPQKKETLLVCGIVGIYNFSDNRPVNRGLLEAMADLLEHRGPDGSGFFFNGNVGLGHRRLKIIDLAGGDQPIYNEDRSICVILNGEIYNFQELREELLKKGHRFYTNSDTEVIVHLYEEDSEGFVIRLRGMFAIAVWDGRSKRLTIARDRVGKKPLYYYTDGNRIIFASEMKSILLDGTVKKEVSLEALSDYLVYLCVLAPKTIYRDINKLLPGHILTCSADGVRIREYWDLPMGEPAARSEQETVEGLTAQLMDAVGVRMVSDVPLGAFLSGGLDSSSVVAFMSQLDQSSVLTASIGFDDKRFDETEYAAKVASYYKTEHYSEIEKPDALDIIEKIAWHMDEPFADVSAIPTYSVSKVMKRHVTVALSGDGGDELLAGYRRYYSDSLENRMRSYIPAAVQKGVVLPIASMLPAGMGMVSRAKSFLTNMGVTQERAHFNSVASFSDTEREGMLHPDVKRKLAGYHPFSMMERYYKKTAGLSDLVKILYVDMKTYLPDRMLVKVDRMSMAHSLEVRSPFLDQRFMEYAASISSDLKLKGAEGKYILKKTMEPHLPSDIIYRQKQGFEVPLDRWLREEFREDAEQIIFAPDACSREFFDYKFLKQMWDNHQSGKINRGERLWCIYMFEVWGRGNR